MIDTPGTIIVPFAALGLPARTVTLTFDDGPAGDGAVTERLLAVLAARQVQAGFCVRGSEVAHYPSIVQRLVGDGHLLVNHSFAHDLRLVMMGREAIGAEIDRGDAAIGQALAIDHYRSRFFRPPGGMVTDHLLAAVRERDMRVLPISFFAYDHLVSPAVAPRLLEYLLARIRRDDGGLLVLHDGMAPPIWMPHCIPSHFNCANRAWVPEVVNLLIERLRDDGFSVGIDGLS